MRLILLVGLGILAFAQPTAAGPGQWVFLLHGANGAGALHFTGAAGSDTPIAVFASVYNNDPAHPLSFDGITLKLDELSPPDPAIFSRLWVPRPEMEMPEAFFVPASGKRTDVLLGHFSLRDAPPGTYVFRLIVAASFEGVSASPPELVTPPLTVTVVPEPGGMLAMGAGLASLAGLLRRRS